MSGADVRAWREREFLTLGDAAWRLTYALGRPVDRILVKRWELGEIALPDDLHDAKLAMRPPIARATRPALSHSIPGHLPDRDSAG